MENDPIQHKSAETKLCPHCQKEIAKKAKRCPYCQTNLQPWYDRHPVLIVILTIIVICVLGSVFSSGNQSTSQVNSTQSNTPAAVSQTPAQVVCGMTPQALKEQAQTIPYAQLEKDPDSYQGTFAKFTGQILQIQQNGNSGVIRLSVTNEGYGIWSSTDVVYVEYNQATSAVDGDIVTIYGMLNGDTTYTSEANYQITLPDMVACGVGAIASTNTTTSSVTTAASSKTQAAPAVTTTQTANPLPVTQPAAATWHTAYTYTGSTDINTPPFTLRGSEQRIDYSCSIADPTDTFGSVLDGGIETTQGLGGDTFADGVNCPTSNSTYEYSLSPGQYYLDMAPINATYTVTVEDFY